MKAVIPAAGLGTRFLPATKAQPKEMLPVVDKPAIQYVVEEAVASGIEDILIITGRGKRAIEDHFDKSIELENYLYRRRKEEALREMQSIGDMANITYIRQKEPLGLGHAVLCAENYVGDEPFAVLLSDDIIVNEVPCTKQLVSIFEERSRSIIAVEKISRERMSLYAMVMGAPVAKDLFLIKDLVEKPPLDRVKSDLATLGRYVLTPRIFDHLRRTKPGIGGEIQLTDAIQSLLGEEEVYAYLFKGKRYDIGNKVDWIRATLELALMREDLREDLRGFLKEISRTIEQV